MARLWSPPLASAQSQQSPVCSSPQPWEEIRARVITLFPCKQAEAQRGSGLRAPSGHTASW